MPYHTIPRNYFATEYPLPHEFRYSFNLAAENEAINSTICTLIQSRSIMDFAPDVVEVNPRHSSFAEETGPAVQIGSIMPKLNVSFTARMPITSYTQRFQGGAATDAIGECIFNWMPIYNSFVEGLDSINEEDDADIESILELRHDTTFHRVDPLFVNTAMIAGGVQNHPMNTIHNADALADYSLFTDTSMRPVAFDSDAFFDTLKYGTNAGMLKKMIGPWHTVRLTPDRSYNFTSKNFTHPMVKRANEFTFCGILFHVPQAGSSRQLFGTVDTTATIAQVHIELNCMFPEWNSQFDQTAI